MAGYGCTVLVETAESQHPFYQINWDQKPQRADQDKVLYEENSKLHQEEDARLMSPAVLHNSDRIGQHITATGKTALDIEAELKFRTE